MGLATLLPLLGFALFFARATRSSYSVALLNTVAGIIVVLYIAGLAHILWWTALLVHLTGVCLLGYEAWIVSRNPARFAIPWPYLLLLLFTLLFVLVHGASHYLFYDEFSHWGVYLKEMLARDAYWAADTNAMHPRYPPATPLWQYLFSVFGAPSEARAYVAQFVLLLTPLLVLWEKLDWRRPLWFLLITILVVVLLADFGLGVSSLYVDPVISAWFIGTILCFVMEPPATLRGALVYALPLTVIALIKTSTIAFTFAAACVLALLAFCGYRRSARGILPSAARSAGLGLLLAVPGLLALSAWHWHLDHIGTRGDIEAVGDIVTGLAADEETADPAQGPEITHRFLQVFSGQQLSNDGVSRQFNAFSYSLRDLFTDKYRLTTLSAFVIYALWWAVLLVFVLRGAARWKWGIVAGTVGLTAAGYVFALYLTYRFASGDYGLVLSSYTRYVNTVVLPMLIVSFAPLLPAFRSDSDPGAWKLAGRVIPVPTALAVAAFVGLYYFETPYLRPIYEPNAVIPLRRDMEPVATAIHNVAGDSPIWIFLPNDHPNRFIGQLLQYLVTPTPAYVERDPAFLQEPSHDIYARWAEFGYVWLAGELDPESQQRFDELLGTETTTRLFRVVSDDSGEVRLVPAASG